MLCSNCLLSVLSVCISVFKMFSCVLTCSRNLSHIFCRLAPWSWTSCSNSFVFARRFFKHSVRRCKHNVTTKQCVVTLSLRGMIDMNSSGWADAGSLHVQDRSGRRAKAEIEVRDAELFALVA